MDEAVRAYIDAISRSTTFSSPLQATIVIVVKHPVQRGELHSRLGRGDVKDCGFWWAGKRFREQRHHLSDLWQ
jgi:hypothetical protein